jgi:Tol biopolymer transport system component
MRVFLPQWSPDGKRIAFVAQTERQIWAVYLVSADGGPLERVLKDDRHQVDPSWSPDGNSLAFGRTPWLEDKKTVSGIAIVNLKTKQTSILPGSEGLYSPQWSPDGRYMRALTAVPPEHRIALFDFSTQRWHRMSEPPAASPNWSRDAKYVHFINPYVGHPRLCRLRVSDKSTEILTEIDEQKLGWTIVGKWTGLASDDSPLVLRDTGIQEIYALDWHVP